MIFFFFLAPLFFLFPHTNVTSDLTIFLLPFPRTHQYLPCRHTQQFKTCPMRRVLWMHCRQSFLWKIYHNANLREADPIVLLLHLNLLYFHLISDWLGSFCTLKTDDKNYLSFSYLSNNLSDPLWLLLCYSVQLRWFIPGHYYSHIMQAFPFLQHSLSKQRAI